MKKLTINQLQERIWQNKKDKGFNTTDVEKELLFLTEELGEAVKAYRKGDNEELAEEIVDLIIYSLGLLKVIDRDAYEEIIKKVEKNEDREYESVDGGWRHLRKDQG